jgi:glycosyltransferase involved in cell wall biosynthesis
VPAVTVVIPTHGRDGYLRVAVQSALSAGQDDVEVIVVDDASPVPVCLPSEGGRVTVLRLNTNSGPSMARNVGIEHARSTICTFLDDDDLLAPGRLVRGIEHVSPGIATMCRVGHAPGDYRPRPINRPPYHGDMNVTLLEQRPPCIGQIMFHKEDFVPFNTSLRSAEDAEWWIRMSKRVTFVDIPEIGYQIRDHVGSRPGRDSSSTLANRELLLSLHAEYFRRRPRARASQFQRVSSAALNARDYKRARSAALRSMRYPSIARVKLLALSLMSGRTMWRNLGR